MLGILSSGDQGNPYIRGGGSSIQVLQCFYLISDILYVFRMHVAKSESVD
jgi:hypothetical protein